MARTLPELPFTGEVLEARIKEANKALELALSRCEALNILLTSLRRIQQLDREEAELEVASHG